MNDTIGIDISKDTLDIHRLSDGKHVRFGNDKEGLTELRRWIAHYTTRCLLTRSWAMTSQGCTAAAGS